MSVMSFLRLTVLTKGRGAAYAVPAVPPSLADAIVLADPLSW
ncbi:MAG: hypothetical protein ABIR34_11005 [Marmoricola sp.]